MPNPNRNIWWGPPKKFSTNFEERKISWLELFYDLVYVIVISKITHRLAVQPSWNGLIEYAYLFCMIFWGWFNGSQYHDLHGTPGIRTRFMTLWQMMAVAALAVTLESPVDKILFRATIGIAILQFYITYLWFSVGIYDKEHRKLNIPYTVSYLAALALIIGTLFIPQPYKRIMFWITILLNFLPPLLTFATRKERRDAFTLSSSMVERFGLFTTIVFGEAILGVINGLTAFKDLHPALWVAFGLGILIVFALWWIFFACIADWESKKGFWAGNMMSLIYIPAFASLGIIGACFPGLMRFYDQAAAGTDHIFRSLYGICIGLFLCCITAISNYLVYPEELIRSKRLMQPILILAGLFITLFTLAFRDLDLIYYLFGIFVILLSIIIFLTRSWYKIELGHLQQTDQ